jgi:hypothetical protein
MRVLEVQWSRALSLMCEVALTKVIVVATNHFLLGFAEFESFHVLWYTLFQVLVLGYQISKEQNRNVHAEW